MELRWSKSSASNPSGNCVEVAISPLGNILVRNSRSPLSDVLNFTPAEWEAFLLGAGAGEFDIDQLNKPR